MLQDFGLSFREKVFPPGILSWFCLLPTLDLFSAFVSAQIQVSLCFVRWIVSVQTNFLHLSDKFVSDRLGHRTLANWALFWYGRRSQWLQTRRSRQECKGAWDASDERLKCEGWNPQECRARWAHNLWEDRSVPYGNCRPQAAGSGRRIHCTTSLERMKTLEKGLYRRMRTKLMKRRETSETNAHGLQRTCEYEWFLTRTQYLNLAGPWATMRGHHYHTRKTHGVRCGVGTPPSVTVDVNVNEIQQQQKNLTTTSTWHPQENRFPWS